MASIYQPSEVALRSALSLLHALRDPMSTGHVAAVSTLGDTVKAGNREFGLLMLHIFVYGAKYGIAGDVRQLAGILVKNECIGMFNIGSSSHLAKDLNGEDAKTLLDTLQASILEGMSDSLSEVRRMNAALLGKIASCYEGEYWVALVPVIANKVQMALSGGNREEQPTTKEHVEGYLYALRLVCEDGPEKLSMHVSRPLDLLVSLFMHVLRMPSGEEWLHPLKLSVLLSMNALLPLGASNMKRHLKLNGGGGVRDGTNVGNNGSSISLPSAQSGASAITIHMNSFLEALGMLAYSPSSDIRRAVCQSLAQLISEQPAALSSGLEGICKYMAEAIRDPNENVAIEACEFWFSLMLHSEAHIEIKKNIVGLVHGAVDKCILTREDMLREREEEEKQATGEKRIYFRVSRDDYGGGGAGDNAVQYTIRRSAALLLDNVAQLYPQNTTSVAVDKVHALLKATSSVEGQEESEAMKRESGMLILGAIAAGCESDLAPLLPGIYPYLLQGLQDYLPEVRAISCWVCSRFIGWVSSVSHGEDVTEEEQKQAIALLGAIFQGLSASLLDSSPKVQASACAALSTILQTNGCAYLDDKLASLLQQVYQAFHTCGLKNRLLLMDLLSIVTEAFTDKIERPNGDGHDEFLVAFMPLLMPYYEESGPDEAVLNVSMECLQSFCGVFCTSMHPYAHKILARAVIIAREILDAHEIALSEASEEGLEYDLPSLDVVSTALDLISALFAGLGSELTTYLPLGLNVYRDHSHIRTFLGLLSSSLLLQSEYLRSATLSVFGELLKNVPWTVAPRYSESLLVGMNSVFRIDEIVEQSVEMIINACWSLGLYALVCRDMEEERVKFRKHLPGLLQRLVAIITRNHDDDEHPHDLRMNFASCLGRVAVVEPQLVAATLPDVLEDLMYCIVLLGHEDSERREDSSSAQNSAVDDDEYMHAWCGIVAALKLNPDALLQSPPAMRAFVHACSECSRLGQEELNTKPCPFLSNQELKTDLRAILAAIESKPVIWANCTSMEMLQILSAIMK